jgi:hypothetical protein
MFFAFPVPGFGSERRGLLHMMYLSGLCLEDWVKLKELSMCAGEPNMKLRLTLGNTLYLLHYIYARKDESLYSISKERIVLKTLQHC